MAKIKFGSVITDSRGTVGGNTFSWSRYGNQLTRKPQTAKLRTERQTAVRANFQLLTKSWWQLLTSTQRDEWRALAAANPRPNTWGDDFPLTGLALFISINRRLNQAALGSTNDAPADQFVTPPSSVAITIAAPATFSVDFTPATLPSLHIAYLKITGPISPGIANFQSKLVFLAASSTMQSSPWDISSEFASRFGDAITDRRYGASLAFLNTDNAALSTTLTTSEIAT